MQNKIFVWIALVTVGILAIPFIAMQIGNKVDWNLADFVTMGTLLFGMGSLFVVAARITPQQYRIILAVVFATAFLFMWIHLAVGIVDTWPLAGS